MNGQPKFLPETGRGTTKWWRGTRLIRTVAVTACAPPPSCGWSPSPFRGGISTSAQASLNLLAQEAAE